MDKSFDSKDFIRELASDLVESFSRASRATTPQLVGSAKERAVKDKLALVLPRMVGIGSGCVIDIYGNTSKQCDVVIYEKEFCPIFSINGNPETTYYPCESVIAIGEIKTSLDYKQLKDSFEKIKSVKVLKRHCVVPTKTDIGGYEFRHYGSKLIASGAVSEEYNQITKYLDQIYAFVLTENVPLKIDTFLQKYVLLSKSEVAHLLPNLTVSLKDGLFLFMNNNDKKIYPTKDNADGIQNLKSPAGDFQYLLKQLGNIILRGRTTNIIPFSEYIDESNSYDLNGPFAEF